MKPSPLLSFGVLERFPRPTRAVCVAIALLALVRAGLWAGGSDRLFPAADSGVDRLYLVNEARLFTSEPASPRVLIMGSSRLGGVTAECLAQRLPLDTSDISNYALAGSTFWRTALFFRRNPEVLSRAEVVILDLLPYQLYESILFTGRDELFLREAQFDERLGLTRPGGRLLAVADAVFPAWSERRRPVWWAKALALWPMTPQQRYQLFLEEQRTNEAAAGMETRDRTELDLASEMAGYAPWPVYSDVQARALSEIAAMLPDGATLLLTWAPIREDFAEYLREDPAGQASLREYQAFIEQFSAPNAEVIWIADGAELGMNAGDFTDIVHYSSSGFEKMCDFYASLIRPRLSLETQ